MSDREVMQRAAMTRVLATVGLLVALLAGCASTDTASPTASPPAGSSGSTAVPSGSGASGSDTELCSALSSLQASVDRLQNLQVTSDGLPALQDALQAVKADAGRVIAAGKARYETQTARLQADLTGLQTAVDAAKANPSAETLSAVRAAVGALADDVRTIAQNLAARC